jgi:hypothetical protein
MIRETLLGGWLRLPASVASPEHFGSKCWGVKGITFAAAVRFGSNDLLLLQESMHALEDAHPYCDLVKYISFQLYAIPMHGVIQAPKIFAYMHTVRRLLHSKENDV